MDDDAPVGVWIMSDAALRLALEAAAAGEPIDLILLGLYANADIEVVGGDDE